MRRRFILGLVLATVAGTAIAQDAPDDDDRPRHPPPEIIESFVAERETARDFVFYWKIHPQFDGVDLTCTLDLDGDTVLEETINDCDDDTSLSHRYDDAPGVYTAVLLVRSADGHSDRATAEVVVGD